MFIRSVIIQKSRRLLGQVIAAPSNLLLNGLTTVGIDEGLAIGTEVGTLTADGDTPITYSIISGDINDLEIVGDKVITSQVFDFSSKGSYTITVQGTNSGGSSQSVEFTITVNEVAQVVPTPLNFRVSQNYIGNTSFGEPEGSILRFGADFNPSPSENFVGYRVYKDGILFSDTFVGADVTGLVNSTEPVFYASENGFGNTIITGLTIRAVDSELGESADSNILNAYSQPSKVTNAILTKLTSTSMKVSWTEVAEGDLPITYKVFRGSGGSGQAGEVVDENEFIVTTGVTEGNFYSFFIQTSNEGTSGVTSTTSVFTNTLTLSPPYIPSNLGLSGIVGQNTTDAAAGNDANTFVDSIIASGATPITYALSGADASSFVISGNQIRTAEVFDDAVKDTYNITVIATNSLGSSEPFNIVITILPALVLTLSNNSIAESNSINDLIGVFSTGVTRDVEYYLNFETVDDDSFNLGFNNGELRAAEVFDFETKSSYTISVYVYDYIGSEIFENFTINITDVAESVAPTNAVAPSISGVEEEYSILTATQGSYTGTSPITITGQWHRDGVAISGATSLTYELQPADIDTNILYKETATNSVDSIITNSNQTGLIQPLFVTPILEVFAPSGFNLGAIGAFIDWNETIPTSTPVDVVRIYVGGSVIQELQPDIRATNIGNFNGNGLVDNNFPLVQNTEYSDLYLVNVAVKGNKESLETFAPSFLTKGFYVPVSDITVDSLTPSSVELSWIEDIGGGAETLTFTVKRRAAGTFGSGISIATDLTSPTFIDNTVNAETNYEYQILQVNSSGFEESTNSENYLSVSTPAIPANAPVNTVAPIITGTETQGETLTVSDGTWTGTTPITYTYQWKRDTVNIVGATNSTYLLAEVDVSSIISCEVTATNVEGSVPELSNNTGQILTSDVLPANTVAPIISGTETQGETLSVTTGTWTGTDPSFTYQWKRDGVNISGANSNTHLLVSADVGTVITCEITASNDAGSVQQLSNATGSIAASATAPVNNTAPAITGTTIEGNTLTVSDGLWSGSEPITYTYQWKRDTVNISGATNNTYALVAGDVGSFLSCEVTATNSVGSTTQLSNTTSEIQASGGTPIDSTLTNIAVNTTSNGVENNPYGYVEYLPVDYDTRNDWPIIVWFSGGGEDGNGSVSALNVIRDRHINNWLKTNDIPFIVVSPQEADARFSGGRMDEMLSWTKLKYGSKYDDKQFHVTVLSASGFGMNAMMQTSGIDWSAYNSVTLHAASEFPQNNSAHPSGILDGKTRVWVHHGTADSVVPLSKRTIFFRNLVQAYGKINTDLYRFTAYTGLGHSAWQETYDGSGRTKTQESGLIDTNASEVGSYYQWSTPETWYDWLLEQTAASGTFTVPGSAIAGETLNFTSDTEYVETFSWDFGDGNTSSLENPTHVYASSGAYDVILTLTNRFGDSTVLATQQVAVDVQTAPSNNVIPTISGTAQEGETLTVGQGSWSGTEPITYTYQWKKDNVAISGATNTTYLLVTADVGSTITVDEIATNSVGSNTATSLPTNAVIAIGAVDYPSEFALRYDLSTTAVFDGSNNITAWNSLGFEGTPQWVPAESAVRTKRADSDKFFYSTNNEQQVVEFVLWLKPTQSGASPQWVFTMAGDNGVRINGTGDLIVFGVTVGGSLTFDQYNFVRIRLDGANSFIQLNDGTKNTFNSSNTFGVANANFGGRNAAGNTVDANWRFYGVALKALNDQIVTDFYTFLQAEYA